MAFLGIFLALAILPYAIVVAMPSWRWFALCALVLGGPLVWVWVQHRQATQLPGYKEEASGFIGIAIFQALTFGVFVGIAVRALSLTLRGFGWPPARCFTVNVFGIVLAAGIVGTYEESQKPQPGSRDTFVQAQTHTPDGKPLTFRCFESGTGLWCRTGYPWRGGAHLGYRFRAPKDAVAETGERVDDALREFLVQFMR